MYSNLIVVVYFAMIVPDIVNQRNLGEMLMVIFGLKKVLREEKVFGVM